MNQYVEYVMNEYVYEYESEYVDVKWMNEYHRLNININIYIIHI